MAFLALLAALPAITADCHAITTNGDFYKIVSSTGSTTLVLSTSFHDVFALARDANGLLWTISGGATSTPTLIAIDPIAPSATALVPLGLGGTARGLAFDAEGDLWVVVRPNTAGFDVLKRVDMNTFVVTTLGSTLRNTIEDLCFAPEGTLYAWDTGAATPGSGLVTLNTTNGVATDTLPAAGNGEVQALAIDEVGRIVGCKRRLFEIDGADGTFAPTSPDLGHDFVGLAFVRQMTDRDGALALEPDGDVWRVNLTTGARALVGPSGIAGACGFSNLETSKLFLAAKENGAVTELWRIDPRSATATLQTSMPLTGVIAMNADAQGFLELAVEGGTGFDDLHYTYSVGLASLAGPFPMVGFDAVKAIAKDPMGEVFVWDLARGLAFVDFGTTFVEVVAGPQPGASFDALVFDPRGRLFATDARLWRFHVPSETATTVGGATQQHFIGIDCFRGPFGVAPITYCTAQTNSAGCVPQMQHDGPSVPSASAGSAFFVRARLVLSGKPGLLFYGVNGRRNTPFLGGTLCVETPVRRCPVQTSTSGGPCSGIFQIDFNQYIASGVDAALVPGCLVDAQWWSRDPGASSTTNLTNALEFTIQP